MSISWTFYTQLFACTEPKSVKKDSQFVSLFMLSGSARAKAAHKYVGEIYPRSRESIVSKDSLQTFFRIPTSQYNNSFTEKNRLCIFLCKINRINCIQNYICISYKVTCSELMFAISNFNLKKLIFLNSLEHLS